MKKIKISAVVPVYNSTKYIEETLNSLQKQSRKFDEIIVVDDGSTDNTINIVKKHHVKLVKSSHGERSVARNRGWKAAKGDVIAFIESDAVYDKEWVKQVLKGFAKGFVAVIDKRKVYAPATYIAKMNNHFFQIRYKNYKPFSAWIFKKEILKKYRGFDEQLIGPEDVDLGKRLLDTGNKIYFAKEAVQYHKGEPKSWGESIRRSFWFGCHKVPYWKKHGKYPWLKIGVFLLLSFLSVTSFKLFSFLFILLYGYVFYRDLRRGMAVKYLFFHPFYYIINEWVLIFGFLWGLVFPHLKHVRKSI